MPLQDKFLATPVEEEEIEKKKKKKKKKKKNEEEEEEKKERKTRNLVFSLRGLLYNASAVKLSAWYTLYLL